MSSICVLDGASIQYLLPCKSEFPNWESNAWPGATVTCAAMCANTAAPSSPRVLEGERAQKNDRMTGRRARHGSRYFVGFFYIPVLLDGGRIDGKFLSGFLLLGPPMPVRPFRPTRCTHKRFPERLLTGVMCFTRPYVHRLLPLSMGCGQEFPSELSAGLQEGGI
ncbi:hypothetical protein DFH09DRAFT_1099721 [Mycena vulgaris]|nr:hypothetical protein DFH09DRAFT_1099721 [Mycena vulgaris]